MEFSGERFIPGEDWSLENEHMHRYMALKNIVKGLRVLDIASGEGYGTSILAQTAAYALGVDIAQDAVHHAQATYWHQDNLKFALGSVTSIPCESHSLDCVVSFETLEHLDQHDEMMKEIRRVLKKDGFLIISTPNKLEYTDIPNYHNEFHVKELYLSDFYHLLQKYFKHIDIYGQRYITTSSISRLNLSLSDSLQLVAPDEQAIVKRPVFHIALCSDLEDRTQLHPSIFFNAEQDIFQRDISKLRWASQVHNELLAEKDALKRILEEKLELETKLNESAIKLQMLDHEARHASGCLSEVQKNLLQERDRYDQLHQTLNLELARPDTSAATAHLLSSSIDELKRQTHIIGLAQKDLDKLIEQARHLQDQYGQKFIDHISSVEQSILRVSKNQEHLEDLSCTISHEHRDLIHNTQQLLDLNQKISTDLVALTESSDPALGQVQATLELILKDLQTLSPLEERIAALKSHIEIISKQQLQEVQLLQDAQNLQLTQKLEAIRHLQDQQIQDQKNLLASQMHELSQKIDNLPQGILGALQQVSLHLHQHDGQLTKLEGIPTQLEALHAKLDLMMQPMHMKLARHPYTQTLKSITALRVIAAVFIVFFVKPFRVARQTWRDRGRNFKFRIIQICRQVYYSSFLSIRSKNLIVKLIYSSPLRVLFKDLHHYQSWCMNAMPAPPLTEEPGDLARSDYAQAVASIKFGETPSPLVSIIIPTYGKVDYTLRCLQSVSDHVEQNSIEVIVLDDKSLDPDLVYLRRIKNLTFIENEENLGFVHNCNKGAQLAKGKFLCFLNNDTYVLKDWLKSMLDVFENHPDTGIVGSKLIFPDGRLQEAGGIVWKDASAWNYGRFANPNSAAFNYLRETDYVSGASLLIEREFFFNIGCFGSEYAPAYCEDTDLCFKSRAAGRKVYYQPRSQLIHYEGVSNGTDTGSGIKAYQVVNQKTFFSKWQSVLEASHWPNAECVFRARERAGSKKFVLVIDHYVPQPDRDAGSRSMYQFMQCMLELGYGVKLLPANLWYDPVYTSWYQDLGIEVIYGDACNGAEDYITQNIENFELVFLSRPHIADPLLSCIKKAKNLPVVFYGHDIHHCRLQQQQLLSPGSVSDSDIESMRQMEMRVWQQLDCIAYPSHDEVAYLTELGFSRKAFLLNPFHVSVSSPPSLVNREPHRLIFVGGFAHAPNIDAAVWFVENVLPLIRQSFPDVHLDLVGSNPSEKVLSLKCDHIHVTGYVPDDVLYDYYGKAKVAIIPLLYGAGIKGKVIEACQMGIPLVTTDVGVQGMPSLAEKIDICNHPSDFAQAVMNLLTSDALWFERARAQQEFVASSFSHATLLKQIQYMLEVSAN